MSPEWRLIFRGFIVAALGASASMFYIVGLSAMFVGRFQLAAMTLALAVLGAVGFLMTVGRYLDVLDQRAGDEPDSTDISRREAVDQAI